MKPAAILFAPVALIAAGPGAMAAPAHETAYARIGETVRLRGIPITPLSVTEDSRCPVDVSCVRAGRVRIVARIGGATRELTLGEPVPMVRGTLRLASVLPARKRYATTIPPRAYRFAFRFDGDRGFRLIRD